MVDTDGDGWSDYKEIYQTNTNPLSVDSDADGVIDSRDIRPLEKLIVKVQIERGHMADTFWLSPTLQATLKNKDTGDTIYSTKEEASKDKKEFKDIFGTVIHTWKSTSVWDDHFYFDVSDDDHRFKIEGRLFLNIFGEYSDLSAKLLKKTFTYDPARGNIVSIAFGFSESEKSRNWSLDWIILFRSRCHSNVRLFVLFFRIFFYLI